MYKGGCVVYILQNMQIHNGKKRIKKVSPWLKVDIWVLKTSKYWVLLLYVNKELENMNKTG